MFDICYQHALHTSSFEEHAISKNSLSNFRIAIYKYNEEHPVDLIQEEIESHAKEFAKMLNINGRNIRNDKFKVYLEDSHKNNTIYRSTDKDIASKRAGVEGIPSVLRRK